MNGARPPNEGLYTERQLLGEYVENLANSGHTAMIPMHSYGRQAGTNTLVDLGVDSRSKQGLVGGVSHLIFLRAFALPKEFGHEDSPPISFDIAEDGTCVHCDPKTLLIEPGFDDAEADAYVSSLGRWKGNGMCQELRQCTWRDVPVAYV